MQEAVRVETVIPIYFVFRFYFQVLIFSNQVEGTGRSANCKPYVDFSVFTSKYVATVSSVKKMTAENVILMNDEAFVLRVRYKPQYTEHEIVKLQGEALAALEAVSELTWLILTPPTIMMEDL